MLCCVRLCAGFVQADKIVIKRFGFFQTQLFRTPSSSSAAAPRFGRACSAGCSALEPCLSPAGGLKLERQFVAEPFEFAKIITREMEMNQRAFVVEEQSREKV